MRRSASGQPLTNPFYVSYYTFTCTDTVASRLLSVLAYSLFVPVYLRAAPEPAMSTKERPKVDLCMLPRQSVSLFERALGNGWRTY